jgi:hypothetical protein
MTVNDCFGRCQNRGPAASRQHPAASMPRIAGRCSRRQKCSSPMAVQSTAAPPERVSDSLRTVEVRMPRGHYLSEAVRDAIWEVRAEGLSEAEVGRRLGLPKRTVSKHLERLGASGRGRAVGLSVA